MQRFDLYLTKNEVKALTAIAKDKGISIAELVRRILDKELGL